MKMELNSIIGFGSLSCSYDGIEGVLEKAGFNTSYEAIQLLTKTRVAKIEEGSSRTYVTMNTGIIECAYDHHIITIGRNEAEVKALHDKVCSTFEKVDPEDKYTKEYLFRFMCIENGISIRNYKEVLPGLHPNIDDIAHQIGGLVSIEVPKDSNDKANI